MENYCYLGHDIIVGVRDVLSMIGKMAIVQIVPRRMKKTGVGLLNNSREIIIVMSINRRKTGKWSGLIPLIIQQQLVELKQYWLSILSYWNNVFYSLT
jgi:hypothetical protein